MDFSSETSSEFSYPYLRKPAEIFELPTGEVGHSTCSVMLTLTPKGRYGTEQHNLYVQGDLSATLPSNPKLCSVPRQVTVIVPRKSYSTSATLPSNFKVHHVSCSPKRPIPPHFRYASVEFENGLRSVTTAVYRSAKLLFYVSHTPASF